MNGPRGALNGLRVDDNLDEATRETYPIRVTVDDTSGRPDAPSCPYINLSLREARWLAVRLAALSTGDA